MLVQEMMSKEVVTIDANDSVFNACLKYKDNKVGCLIVKDKESCVGIITERDVIERTICTKRDPSTTTVKDIMSQNLIVIHPLKKFEKAIELMTEYHIKKIPVVNEDYLVGIITLSDIAHARSELSERFINSWIKPRWE